jgi:hypothetical protein
VERKEESKTFPTFLAGEITWMAISTSKPGNAAGERH